MESKKEQIVDTWALDDYEPQILSKYEKVLSLKVNYKSAYRILAAVLFEMELNCHDTEIVFARRCEKLCGMCISNVGKSSGTFSHKITLYKGYYTLGVLLHEYAHALVYQEYTLPEEEDHGPNFNLWFVYLAQFANMLYKKEPETFSVN